MLGRVDTETGRRPSPVHAVQWTEGAIRLLDQRLLPGREEYLDCRQVDDVVTAIRTLAVRGAPALGAVGALGVALAIIQGRQAGWDDQQLETQIDRIRAARPTAVNLAWGVDSVLPRRSDGVDAVLAAAQRIIDDDQAANRKLSRLGADWIRARIPHRDAGIRVVTHCNTGALATTGWGTAYGIIHELHDRGHLGLVFADETRPLLQGARLTSWELTRDGIDHVVQCDGAAASTILRGMADVVIIGADRIAANGDTANKIGSVGLALACQRAGIPFVVAAPFSTVDPATPSGADIEIEQRDGEEVLSWRGVGTAPAGSHGFNPAFDITPRDLIDAIVTERGVVQPAFAAGSDMLAG